MSGYNQSHYYLGNPSSELSYALSPLLGTLKNDLGYITPPEKVHFWEKSMYKCRVIDSSGSWNIVIDDPEVEPEKLRKLGCTVYVSAPSPHILARVTFPQNAVKRTGSSGAIIFSEERSIFLAAPKESGWPIFYPSRIAGGELEGGCNMSLDV